MLRDEFCCPAIEVKPRARRVLVNFGGFDAAMQTHHAMLALADFHDLEIDFVAGADNPAWEQMQSLAEYRPNWRLHSFVCDFYRLMSEVDLFIGAGGGTSWERAAMGLPTICIAVSNNQQANGEVMAASGAHVFMGNREQVSVEQLRQAIGFIVGNQGIRQSLAERSRQLVDGRGAQRVAAALAGGRCCRFVRPLRTMRNCCSTGAMPRRYGAGRWTRTSSTGNGIRPGWPRA